MSKNIFQALDRPRLARSGFDLSHEHKTTFDMGQLIPISHFECIPGDVHKLSVSAVIRFQPLVAPVMHSIKVRYYSFFVPYRLLFEDWEEFITRGEDGNSVISLPVYPNPPGDDYYTYYGPGTLWDYFGYNPSQPSMGVAHEVRPLDFGRRAYWLIYNEFFRVPGLQDEMALDSILPNADYVDPFSPTNKNWVRDYFTAALPFQQRGTPPALPVFGSVGVDSDMPTATTNVFDIFGTPKFMAGDSGSVPKSSSFMYLDNLSPGMNAAWKKSIDDSFQAGLSVDGAGFSSVDIADLRLAWQTQVWLERNARGGARYTEQLQMRYGTSPRDERLQRPEFIGGYTAPVLISEVLQTSQTDVGVSPQGNMAGHGISVDGSGIGSYRVQEHGLIMILACVDPAPSYQQGISRSWLRRNTLDFPAPEFAHLSEQAIYQAELYNIMADSDPDGSIGRTPFGYTGMYNEMRYIPNFVSGEMRNTFDYWHLSRKFTGTPSLNSEFLKCEPSKRIFAVQNVPGIIGNFGIGLKSFRPLPYIAVPSQIGG